MADVYDMSDEGDREEMISMLINAYTEGYRDRSVKQVEPDEWQHVINAYGKKLREAFKPDNED